MVLPPVLNVTKTIIPALEAIKGAPEISLKEERTGSVTARVSYNPCGRNP
jgi:hypothetical protein